MLDPDSTEGRAALAALLAPALGTDLSVGSLTALSGGASSATWSLEVEAGCTRHALIFQRSASAGHGSLPRRLQAAVQRRAGALGVPVAEVLAIAAEGDPLGDAVVTRRVAGEALAPRWLKSPDYADARAALTQQCAEALARLHAAPLAHWADLALPGGSPAELLDRMDHAYRGFGQPIAAFDLAFAVLRPLLPDTPPTCLAHGDFRAGNFLVGPQGLTAVLDWELTHRSVPGEDLGWLCVQAWRFGQWQQPVGGFGTRAELLAAYRAAGGRIDDDALWPWELFGNLKWGMSCLQLADDHVSGRVPSVERAAIGRRVSEVAADLVHMIAFGEV